MSRCFPYPPPGYTLSKAKIEALIGSIKLENERQKIREQRKKEKIRDKKEKKRKKHRKHKDKKQKSNGFLIKPDISNGHVSRMMMAEDKIVYTRTEVENEQFNGSSLTEEHGASIFHCSSSDNSEAGNKRKRHSSHSNGNSLLMQLPLDTQNYFEASDKEQTRCASSGGTSFFVGNKDAFHLRNLSQRSDEHKPVLKSAPESVKTSQKQRMAQEYKNLVDNWAPPLNFRDPSLYSDDMDWLFHGNKNRDMPPEKRRKCGSEVVPCSRGSSLWPRAVYLHEVNVYALPLTIPF